MEREAEYQKPSLSKLGTLRELTKWWSSHSDSDSDKSGTPIMS
jgi:hypothetical protein